MGSFQRAFLGYRRPEVDAAMLTRDTRINELMRQLAVQAELDEELSSLSGMVIEREREIRILHERLQEANARHDRNLATLESVTDRLQEIEEQARGQATRIRMKALREAVEVGRRAQEVSDAEAPAPELHAAPEASNGHVQIGPGGLLEGMIRVEVGPLGDYAQLVGIEDAIGDLGATDISIERFSEGRATLSMHLDEPVDLLRELEERSPLEFNVHRSTDSNLILGADEDEGQHAA